MLSFVVRCTYTACCCSLLYRRTFELYLLKVHCCFIPSEMFCNKTMTTLSDLFTKLVKHSVDFLCWPLPITDNVWYTSRSRYTSSPSSLYKNKVNNIYGQYYSKMNMYYEIKNPVNLFLSTIHLNKRTNPYN